MTSINSPVFRRTWILTDGKAGDLAQCLGVAQALGVEAEKRKVSPAPPWVWMMPFGPVPLTDRYGMANGPLEGPEPDLIIAAGWRTLAYIREMKKRFGRQIFTVFLKNPRCRAGYVDLIWAPEHDGLHGERVISSLAGPHRFSPACLQRDFANRPDRWKDLPAPLGGVLLGGDSRHYRFGRAEGERLAGALLRLGEQGAGLVITPSRRTPQWLQDHIRKSLEGRPVYWWDNKDPNPYGYILQHADFFIVTADSANMIGEVCVTGRPVYVFKPEGGSKKFDRLLAGFEAYGATRPLLEQGEKLATWSYPPLYAADDIAREIEKRARTQFFARE